MAQNTKPRSLRQRIADWPPLTETVGRCLAGYLRLVRATSSWEEDGYAAVRAALAEHGAVILVFWHQRTFATPYVFDTATDPGRSLNADTRMGLVARAMLHRFGYQTIAMPRGKGGMNAVREVLRGLAGGVSIGIAVDGPRGPAGKSKPFPVQWARASGKPVFVFSFAAKRRVLWPSWDRLMLPLPFTRMVLVWREWPVEVPRRASEEDQALLLAQLDEALNEVSRIADARIGNR